MKKTASILLAVVVVLTGIHLSVASHFCCGQLAAVKVSFTENNASCGMEADESVTLPSGSAIKSHCCTNEVITLSVDPNYSPSYAKTSDILQKVTPVCGTLLSKIDHSFILFQNIDPVHKPPGALLISAVEQDEICVFRI